MPRTASVLALFLAAGTAAAHGHLFRRSSAGAAYYAPSVRYYYAPAPLVVPSYPVVAPPVAVPAPVVVEPAPVVVAPPPAAPLAPVPAPALPPRPVMPRAAPEAAPPSPSGPVLPPPRPEPPARTASVFYPATHTSLKAAETYYTTHPGGDARAARPGGYAVTFWNLSEAALTVRAAGESRLVPRGRSATFEVGREFTWQAGDRREETGRVPAGEGGLTVVIRR